MLIVYERALSGDYGALKLTRRGAWQLFAYLGGRTHTHSPVHAKKMEKADSETVISCQSGSGVDFFFFCPSGSEIVFKYPSGSKIVKLCLFQDSFIMSIMFQDSYILCLLGSTLVILCPSGTKIVIYHVHQVPR